MSLFSSIQFSDDSVQVGMQIFCSCLKIKARGRAYPWRLDSIGGGGVDGGTSALSIMNIKEKFQFLNIRSQAVFGQNDVALESSWK